MTSTVVVDGASLTCAAVTAVARREARVAVGERAVAAARAAWQTGQYLAARQPVYGRNTGVGFETPDARALYEEFTAKGISVEGGVIGGDGNVPPLFFFKDLDGNTLLVAEAAG